MLAVVALSVVAALAPIASATSCAKNSFFYADRDCCLPHNGPSNPPSPPSGCSCPDNWYYHSSYRICAPRHPVEPDCNPSCPNNYVWDKSSHTCLPPKPKCSNNQFHWADKDCCLPKGGIPQPPSPPHGKKCPPYWYWHHTFSCCVPTQPSPPPPTCQSGWKWGSDTHCCHPGNPSGPPPPQPSYYKRDEKAGHSRRRRQSQRDQATFCPAGFEHCPVVRNGLAVGEMECVDTETEMTSCGGCTSIGQGQDCTEIKNAVMSGTSCQKGVCVVHYCRLGFKPSADRSSCVPAA